MQAWIGPAAALHRALGCQRDHAFFLKGDQGIDPQYAFVGRKRGSGAEQGAGYGKDEKGFHAKGL